MLHTLLDSEIRASIRYCGIKKMNAVNSRKDHRKFDLASIIEKIKIVILLVLKVVRLSKAVQPR